MKAEQIIKLFRKRYQFICSSSNISNKYYLTFLDTTSEEYRIELKKNKIYSHIEYLNIYKKVEKMYE